MGLCVRRGARGAGEQAPIGCALGGDEAPAEVIEMTLGRVKVDACADAYVVGKTGSTSRGRTLRCMPEKNMPETWNFGRLRIQRKRRCSFMASPR